MVEVGSVCVKIAGRDAGKVCVVMGKVDDTFVLIDGCTRKRKCNVRHLHLLDKKVKVTKSTSTSDVKKLLKKEGFSVVETKKKAKKEKSTKPVKKRKVKPKKPKKKKEAPKKETKKKAVKKKSVKKKGAKK